MRYPMIRSLGELCSMALSALLLAAIALSLAGCGGSQHEVPPPPAATLGSATIGPEGGTVQGPDGLTLEVPEGALSEPTTIRIARSAIGAPSLPDGLSSDLAVYEVTPHELQFHKSVKLRVPAGHADGREALAMAASAGGEWETQRVTRVGDALQIERRSLSYYIFTPWTPWECVGPGIRRDPNGCEPAQIKSQAVTSTPAGALPDRLDGPVVIADSTLHFDLELSAAVDCSRAQLTIDRLRVINNRLQAIERLLTRPVTLVPISARRAGARENFDAPLTAADNGAVTYAFRFNCTRSVRNLRLAAYGFFFTRVDVPPAPGLPTITQQPGSLNLAAGQAAAFSVRASAPNSLSVDWERSNDSGTTWSPLGPGVPLPGGSDLTLTAQLADDGAMFRARVCNVVALQRNCVLSGVASLAVTPTVAAPSFSAQPQDISVAAGQTASFTAVAAGTPTPALRWQVAAPGSSVFVDVTGEPGCVATLAAPNTTQTAGTCTIAQTPVAASGQRYRAVAANGVANVESIAATLTVTSNLAPPVFTLQPQETTAQVRRSARFTYEATGSAPMTVTWRLDGIDLPAADGAFSVGTCTGNVQYSVGSLTINDLGAGCQGRYVSVFLANGVGPGVGSAPALLSIYGTHGVLWSAPGVAVDYGTAIGIPDAGLAAGNGAAVTDGNVLRLLVGTLPPNTTIAGVSPVQIQVIGAGNSTYRAVLYQTDPTGGGTCGASLVASVVYQDAEGLTSLSPPITLFNGAAGSCMSFAGVQSPRGFEFALTSSGAAGLITGRFDISYSRDTGAWSVPSVSTQALALTPECANSPNLREGSMASVYSGFIDLSATASRTAAMIFTASNPAQGSVTCATTLADNGIWSPTTVVWTHGVDGNGAAVISEPVLTMDPQGNALLAAARGTGAGHELALGWLPAASSA